MFSRRIVESDSFMDMPLTVQALYLHLGVRADDDGFVNPRFVMRSIGSSSDDLKVLIVKGYVIPFESGVIVITHWKENNYIQSDRYQKTIYAEEMSRLSINNSGFYLLTEGINNVYKMDTQDRLGKDSIGKDSRERDPHLLKEIKYSKREEITSSVLDEIAQRYEVPTGFVSDCWDTAQNWLDAKGKVQKNYRAFLSNWVKRERADFLLKTRRNNGRGGVVDARTK